MPKRVLFISYDGMTDPLGQSQVIPYLVGLASLGHSITILSAEKENNYKKLSLEISLQLGSAHITWKPVKWSNELQGVSALRNYRVLRHVAIKLCRSSSIDIIHGRSYIPSMIGLEMKKKFGVRLIFDMRGFWADERVEGKLWNLNLPWYRFTHQFFKRQEKQLLKESDAIVSLTNNAKREMVLRQIPDHKIWVIPCCADLSFFSPEKIEASQQMKWKEIFGIGEQDFIVSYAGSLGTWYLLNEMLKFFKILLKKKSGSKFLFITHEPQEKILSSAREHKISREKIIVIAATRPEMPVLLSLSHLAVFFIRNTFSKKASSPTKMGEIMSLGIPLICNDGIGDVSEIIEHTQAGFVLKDFSDAEFTKAADASDDLQSIPPQKIREGAREFYSLQKGIDQYHRIYSSM